MTKNQSPSDASSREMVAPISFAEACSLVASHSAAILSANAFKARHCDLLRALGRVLAAPVLADRDQPPFPRVTRDGFAVRAEDIASATPLRVVGQLRAGEPWPPGNPPLAAGEAVEIMTGAALPPGADAVLMVEHVQETLAGWIDDSSAEASLHRSVTPQVGRTLTAGENVVPRGSEARYGELLLEPGTRLGPEHIALAASCGLRSIPVFPQPRVAILATGDELVEPSLPWPGFEPPANQEKTPIQSHQIYDSNSFALSALLRRAGAIPLRQRPALDQLDDLADCIRQGLDAAPLLLLTGGVSMGKFDLVEDVLASMGAEFFFTGVTMQPGKPVVFGRVPATETRAARYFFGLPGNPVSAMVTFRLFVQPVLAAMSGEQRWQPNMALARLAAELRVKPGLTRFLPAHLDTSQPVATVTAVRTQGSGDLAANARANCYVIVPDNCDVLVADQIVQVLLR
ncbi:MAG: molybdopterin molybdotransferase MoeA [Acidobacteriaceae bacterium]